ncbi:Flp pilus assembly protein CpaB [Terrabacter sp. BE26]|uniref:Flp pilus assembly protein CpaB n=1 Tax=Terrabacter sp. BE26 TaxID=2898152 RepID=UPI0035BE7D94
MNRRLLAALLALLLAAAGGGLVLVYAKNADQRALAGAQLAGVWVAQKLVPAGTTLKAAEEQGLLTHTKVSAEAVPAGALEEINAGNRELLALSDVQPGEYVLAARFGTTPPAEKAIEVPAGKLAVSVQLSDPARVGTFVTPGSHIAIYTSYKIKALGDDARSKKINDNDIKGTSVLLDDVLVIGVGTSALAAPAKTDGAAAPAANSTGVLVTVAVPPGDAAKLIHGVANYTLYAALRGSGVKIDPNQQANDLNLFPGTLP